MSFGFFSHTNLHCTIQCKKQEKILFLGISGASHLEVESLDYSDLRIQGHDSSFKYPVSQILKSQQKSQNKKTF